MSDTAKAKTQSALVQAVLALDNHFSELDRLGGRIQELDLKSNSDINQTERLLLAFAENGQAVATHIMALSQALNEAREKAEAIATQVSERANQLQALKDNVQVKMDQFHQLSQKVSALNDSLKELKPIDGQSLSEADRNQLLHQLTQFEVQIQPLIEEAQALKEAGRVGRIKVLEQNAESMRQSLQAVSQKLAMIRPPAAH